MEHSEKGTPLSPWDFFNQDGKYLFKLAKCALALLSLEAATKGVPISGVQAASLGFPGGKRLEDGESIATKDFRKALLNKKYKESTQFKMT